MSSLHAGTLLFVTVEALSVLGIQDQNFAQIRSDTYPHQNVCITSET